MSFGKLNLIIKKIADLFKRVDAHAIDKGEAGTVDDEVPVVNGRFLGIL